MRHRVRTAPQDTVAQRVCQLMHRAIAEVAGHPLILPPCGSPITQKWSWS